MLPLDSPVEVEVEVAFARSRPVGARSRAVGARSAVGSQLHVMITDTMTAWSGVSST